MSNTVVIDDFATKFSMLNSHNQKYIIAIQQALIYAQESENLTKVKISASDDA